MNAPDFKLDVPASFAASAGSLSPVQATPSVETGVERAEGAGGVPPLCACGCGVPLNTDYRGKYNRFHRGHQCRQSWAEGKMESVRGRHRSPEEQKRQKAGVKAAWRAGKYDSASTRQKQRASLDAHRKGRSPEHMAKMVAGRDIAALKPKWSAAMKERRAEWKRNGLEEKVKLAQRKALIGTHGHGLSERGRPDHCAAKYWVIRDPLGRVYECSNLREWVRSHLDLFEDERPESRMPFADRVYAGIAQLADITGRKTHSRGWVLVSVRELNSDAADLLGRDEAELVSLGGGGGVLVGSETPTTEAKENSVDQTPI